MSARHPAWATALVLGALAGAAPSTFAAADDILDPSAYDPENGEYIMEMCAGCHGEYGEGGGGGEYPRLAGLPAEYLAAELRKFKTRERLNISMAPYATERELPEDDVRDISLFLSEIELLNVMPALADTVEAYERLMIAKRVFNVARVEGDVARGESIYRTSCRRCHGSTGRGGRRIPPLAGQYTEYLRAQITKFLDGERAHKNVEKYLRPYADSDWTDLLAFLSVLDD